MGAASAVVCSSPQPHRRGGKAALVYCRAAYLDAKFEGEGDTGGVASTFEAFRKHV